MRPWPALRPLPAARCPLPAAVCRRHVGVGRWRAAVQPAAAACCHASRRVTHHCARASVLLEHPPRAPSTIWPPARAVSPPPLDFRPFRPRRPPRGLGGPRFAPSVPEDRADPAAATPATRRDEIVRARLGGRDPHLRSVRGRGAARRAAPRSRNGAASTVLPGWLGLVFPGGGLGSIWTRAAAARRGVVRPRRAGTIWVFRVFFSYSACVGGRGAIVVGLER